MVRPRAKTKITAVHIQAMAQQNVEVGTVLCYFVFFFSILNWSCWFFFGLGVKLPFWVSWFQIAKTVFFWRKKSPTQKQQPTLTLAGARGSTFYGGRWGVCWDPQVFNGIFHGNGWFWGLVMWMSWAPSMEEKWRKVYIFQSWEDEVWVFVWICRYISDSPMLGSHTVEGDRLKQSPRLPRLSHTNSKTPSWLGMQNDKSHFNSFGFPAMGIGIFSQEWMNHEVKWLWTLIEK